MAPVSEYQNIQALIHLKERHIRERKDRFFNKFISILDKENQWG